MINELYFDDDSLIRVCHVYTGIRTLQCVLLKVALLMGVEVHPGVTFEGFIEPVDTLIVLTRLAKVHA
jgi:hypothetical protein